MAGFGPDLEGVRFWTPFWTGLANPWIGGIRSESPDVGFQAGIRYLPHPLVWGIYAVEGLCSAISSYFPFFAFFTLFTGRVSGSRQGIPGFRPETPILGSRHPFWGSRTGRAQVGHV